MDLSAAGLSDIEATTYLKLLEQEAWKPSDLATAVGLTRTNMYKVLDRLVDMGLASRADRAKKLHYSAESPAVLNTLARERRDSLTLQARQIETVMPDLMKQYFRNHEQPGVRFYHGHDGIKEIYSEQIRVGLPIQFLKTRADFDFFGFRFMHEVRNMAPKAGIHRKAFTPDAPEVPVDIEASDQAMLLERTWYLPEDYTAPVEWSVYGDKVSIISFDKEAIGMVIDSPQIAESLRQIFNLLDEGLKRRPGYDHLPARGEFTDVESFIHKYENRAPKL